MKSGRIPASAASTSAPQPVQRNLDAHGLEHVSGFGLGVLDHRDRQFAHIADGHGHVFAGERRGGKQ
jgi:hypothetical protein